jgi:hypothetical protein
MSMGIGIFCDGAPSYVNSPHHATSDVRSVTVGLGASRPRRGVDHKGRRYIGLRVCGVPPGLNYGPTRFFAMAPTRGSSHGPDFVSARSIHHPVQRDHVDSVTYGTNERTRGKRTPFRRAILSVLLCGKTLTWPAFPAAPDRAAVSRCRRRGRAHCRAIAGGGRCRLLAYLRHGNTG